MGCGERPAALLLPALGLERRAELPGREAGPTQASALELPGLQMTLMLSIKYVVAKALSSFLGAHDIVQARPGCLNSVQVSSGESSLQIASCPLSRVSLFSNIVVLAVTGQERL